MQSIPVSIADLPEWLFKNWTDSKMLECYFITNPLQLGLLVNLDGYYDLIVAARRNLEAGPGTKTKQIQTSGETEAGNAGMTIVVPGR